MMIIMPPRQPRLSDLPLPPRTVTADLSDDEITGVVSSDFYDEPSVPMATPVDADQTGRVLSYRDLEEVETVYAALKLLLRRHKGEARELVRARLACALEDL